jgi:RimK family alpha-L-glutamate ligase
VFALVANRETPTNRALASCAWNGSASACLTPSAALARLRPFDIALGRLDVRPTLDGVEPGLWALAQLASHGVRVLNPPSALLTAHDKLLTARRLVRAGVAHPATVLALPGQPISFDGPVVVKPRFGSWGRDVVLCADPEELRLTLAGLEQHTWFRAQGALVQELVPPLGYDLRVVVAGGRVVGAVERRAAPGEWRTNVALGAARRPVEPNAEACDLAVAAAAAAGADLVGVDLLPTEDGFVVLELNGAVDFTRAYARDTNVFRAAVQALSDAVAATEVAPELSVVSA